jgi:hypothetical protein
MKICILFQFLFFYSLALAAAKVLSLLPTYFAFSLLAITNNTFF